MLSEDLAQLISADGIGDMATVGTASVIGVFERQYAEANNIEGYYPTFLCNTADADGIAKGAEVAVGGEVFRVLTKRPDGTGITLIIFELA